MELKLKLVHNSAKSAKTDDVEMHSKNTPVFEQPHFLYLGIQLVY